MSDNSDRWELDCLEEDRGFEGWRFEGWFGDGDEDVLPVEQVLDGESPETGRRESAISLLAKALDELIREDLPYVDSGPIHDVMEDFVEVGVGLIDTGSCSGETTVENGEEETPDCRYIDIPESRNHHQRRMMAHIIKHVKKH